MTNIRERQMLYINDVEQITGKNRLTLRRWWMKDHFPKPKKLASSGLLVWHAQVIQQWINENV